MFGEELPRQPQRTRDRGRGHELRKIQNPDFFRSVADARRVIDHQCFALDALQQMGSGDVTEIEWRILAHQNDIYVAAEIEDLRFAEAEMIAGDALDGDRIA